MSTETITVRVDPQAARVFNSASQEDRRRLETLMSLWLIEAGNREDRLEDLVREIGRKARQRGLTPELLSAILDEQD